MNKPTVHRLVSTLAASAVLKLSLFSFSSALFPAAFVRRHTLSPVVNKATMDWIPSHPRGSDSHYYRHRRQRSFMHQESNASDQPARKQHRRQNRPGCNSYLKVVLDSATLSRLHQMTIDIRERFYESINEQEIQADELPVVNSESYAEAPSGQSNSVREGDANDQKPPHGSKRPLAIKARSIDSLHMTFFFGGETLCGLPSNELADFHSSVRQLLEENGFVQESNRSQENTNIDPSQYFRIKEIRTFPPRRNNLIVAVLEAPELWNSMHDAIRDIAKNGSSEALQSTTAYSKDRWTPHVTLANLFGGSRVDAKDLDSLLQEMTARKCGKKPFMLEAKGLYIAMGGPIPEQVPLDWTFYSPTL